MNTDLFLVKLVSEFVMIPLAILCILPLHHRMRLSIGRTLSRVLLFYTPFLVLSALISTIFKLRYPGLFPVVLICSFAAYRLAFKVESCKAVFLASLNCALMSFIVNYAIGLDSIFHSDATINDYSIGAGIIQSVLALLMCILLAYPSYKYISRLIERFNVDKIWYASSAVPLFMLCMNLIIMPRHYSTLHVNKVSVAFFSVVTIFLVVLLFLLYIFYFIITSLLELSDTAVQNQILRMQESQYVKQHAFLDESSRARHDFKHLLHTINVLAGEGNLPEIKKIVSQYEAASPVNDIKRYTRVLPVNALLNYMAERAGDLGIPFSLEVNLPPDTNLNSNDLCIILGNILDNAIRACKEIPESESRFIDLTINYQEDSGILYIIESNSFDGNPTIQNGKYISSGKGGSGIGLESVKSFAARYRGAANFSHEGKEFYSEVMLRSKS